MAHSSSQTPLLRKTRIVCISDTHNQTPRLPKGDVLIHAGDLTNQGSFSELNKTVEWLEKTDFERKIVIAGNHEITFDADFYEENKSRWKWSEPQDPVKNRKLLEDSPSITYLEHQAATIYLDSPNGPHTCFNVFGSPFTPNRRNWAFKYEPGSLELWDAMPLDTDIAITHTPPKGHGDSIIMTEDFRSGCEVLLQTLSRVRPLMSVFGHIHEARGVDIVRWNVDSPENGCLEEGTEVWKDPGIGNKKQSLVNLTEKGGRPLMNSGALTRCKTKSLSLASDALEDGLGGQSDASGFPQLNLTSRPKGVPHNEAVGKAMLGGPIEDNGQAATSSDIGLIALSDVEWSKARRETAMVNAALLGPRIAGRPQQVNKPIIVDLDLPVW